MTGSYRGWVDVSQYCSPQTAQLTIAEHLLCKNINIHVIQVPAGKAIHTDRYRLSSSQMEISIGTVTSSIIAKWCEGEMPLFNFLGCTWIAISQVWNWPMFVRELDVCRPPLSYLWLWKEPINTISAQLLWSSWSYVRTCLRAHNCQKWKSRFLHVPAINFIG